MSKIYRQLSYRVTSSSSGFNKDLDQCLKLFNIESRKLFKLLLCGCKEDNIYIQESADSEPYLFHKQAIFAELFQGRKLTNDILYYLQGVYTCMLNIEASKFASNFHNSFTKHNKNFNKRATKSLSSYEKEYVLIEQFLNNEIDKICLPNANTGKISLIEKNDKESYPHSLYLHRAKHQAILLQNLNIFPFFNQNYNPAFVKNIIFDVASSLKDFVRKNNICVLSHKNHEEQKESQKLKLVDFNNEIVEIVKLLESNQYSIRDKFFDNWDNIVKNVITNDNQTSCPSFIFDFLCNNNALLKNNVFHDIINYINDCNYVCKGYAIQPIYINNGLLFGAGICEANIKVNDQNLNIDLKLYPDGINVKKHSIKCHIPRKYRQPSIEFKKDKEKDKDVVKKETKKEKKGDIFKYEFSFIEEKAFKRKETDVTKTIVNSFFLRFKKSKNKKNQVLPYVYLPLCMPWNSKKISEKTKIETIVKTLDANTLIAAVDLGINELLKVSFAKKSIIPNLDYDNLPFEIVDCQLVNIQFTRDNTFSSIWADINKIQNCKKALKTFDNRDKCSSKIKKQLNEFWNKITLNMSDFEKQTRLMIHKLYKKYYNLSLKKKDKVKWTLWQEFEWMRLSVKIKSILKGQALKGKVFKFREKIDYSKLEFGYLIPRLEQTIGNQKKDILKKIASYFAYNMNKLNVKYCFFENLRTFKQDYKNKKTTNYLLQNWSHRNLIQAITQACEEYEIVVCDNLDPRYSSQIHAKTQTWMFRAQGSKIAIDSNLQQHDADENATINLITRIFGRKIDHLFSDVIIQDDIAISKKGEVFTIQNNGWIKQKIKKDFPESGKIIRLYNHEGIYLNFNDHKKLTEAIKTKFNKFKDQQSSFVNLGEIDTTSVQPTSCDKILVGQVLDSM